MTATVVAAAALVFTSVPLEAWADWEQWLVALEVAVAVVLVMARWYGVQEVLAAAALQLVSAPLVVMAGRLPWEVGVEQMEPMLDQDHFLAVVAGAQQTTQPAARVLLAW